MSLLNPERAPVKIYKWDDIGAPELNKTANCMINIFKACLVTGYGAKDGAGWTMPFEDAASGVKVFSPPLSPDTDFYLRVSADTGTEMAAQIYLNMTDANTGDLKLQCATSFKYAKIIATKKWLLIASARGFWFCCEQNYNTSRNNNAGAYFFAGVLAGATPSSTAIYIQHTGGTYDNGYYNSITQLPNGHESSYVRGRLLINGESVAVDITSWGNGSGTSENTLSSLGVITHQGVNYYLPGFLIPVYGTNAANFDTLYIAGSGNLRHLVVFGSSTHERSSFFIMTDYWDY